MDQALAMTLAVAGIAFALGGVAIWLVMRAQLFATQADLRTQLDEARARLDRAEAARLAAAGMEGRAGELGKDKLRLEQELREERAESARRATALAQAAKDVDHAVSERERLQGVADAAGAALHAAQQAQGELAARLGDAVAKGDRLAADLDRAGADGRRRDEEIATLKGERDSARQALEQVRAEHQQKLVELEGTRKEVIAAKETLDRMQAMLTGAREEFATQFTHLSNTLFEAKAAQLRQVNDEALKPLLEPLRLRLQEFAQSTTAMHGEAKVERDRLDQAIKTLGSTTLRLSGEATALTEALRGSSKTRGNWGEMILAKILEDSGMREGHEFRTQVSETTEEGRRLQPDVVVDLPNQRVIVIDSKVALNDWDAAVRAGDEDTREAALSRLALAMKGHMLSLARKDYSALFAQKSLDYTFMFVPIEPALQAALERAPALMDESIRHRVAILSPNTLMAMLRTIGHLWSLDRQQRNAEEIAQRGRQTLNALHEFLAEFESIGKSIEGARHAFERAQRRLDAPRGLGFQATKLEQLGVVGKKRRARSEAVEGLALEADIDALGGNDATGASSPDAGESSEGA